MKAIRYFATRNPQTLAELCFLPADGEELFVWTIWLLFAITER